MPPKLDWNTSLRNVNLGAHWRQILFIVIGMAVSTVVSRRLFPHTFWFMNLWAGLATGGTIGMAVGTWWQLREDARRPRTSGWLIVITLAAWGCFCAIAIFVMGPELQAQENQRAFFRSLNSADIESISIRADGTGTHLITDRQSIDGFVEHSKRAELFYPSHEGSTFEFYLIINQRHSPQLEFPGRVPERNTNDISLDFRAYIGMSEIRIPDGQLWLTSVMHDD